MSLIDRISAGLNRLADRTTQALDTGRVRFDIMQAKRRRDAAARDLGYVTWRQAKGTAPAEGEVDGLVRRIDDIGTEVARLETQLQGLRGNGAGDSKPEA